MHENRLISTLFPSLPLHSTTHQFLTSLENQGVEAGRQLDEAAIDHQDVTDQEADLQKNDHLEDLIETEAAAVVETGILDETDDDPDLIQDKQLMKDATTIKTEKDKMKEKKITDIREKFYVKTEFDLLLLL